jgi:hypothetical protein
MKRGVLALTFGFALVVGFPLAASAGPANDADSDGVSDLNDNCTNVANPTQCDQNSDGYGNACDGDYNEDGVVGLVPDFQNFSTAFGLGTGIEQDSNCDGVVGLVPDFQTFVSEFGKAAPGPSGLACAGGGEGACPPIL